MSAINLIREIKGAIANLNPDDVRRTAERPLAIGLVASSGAAYEAMERFLLPSSQSEQKRAQVGRMLHRAGDSGLPSRFDIVLYDRELPAAENAFTYYSLEPERTVREILEQRQELGLPLARSFPPFRPPVVSRIIHTISRENALFALATALPNIVPNLVELPWAIGEFASDTAFLTMNQIRMAFLIGAASDTEIGYREQKAEIASIIAGAFGWRGLARELVGKIPFGGGLIPKGAVAYAGTYVVGLSLERFERLGYGLTRMERKEAYQDALKHGHKVSEVLLASVKLVNAV